AAALVPEEEPARRAGQRDDLQRGVLGDPGAARLAAADLHHLQRRLPAVLLARPARLLRVPAAPPGHAPAVPAADLLQLDRPGGLRGLDGHLLLRRLGLAPDPPRPSSPAGRRPP